MRGAHPAAGMARLATEKHHNGQKDSAAPHSACSHFQPIGVCKIQVREGLRSGQRRSHASQLRTPQIV